MRFKDVKDWYVSKPLANSIGNSAAIYGGLTTLAYVAGRAFNANGLEDALNFSSPLASGCYLMHRTKEINNSFLKNLSKIGITTAAIGLFGNSISNFNADVKWSEIVERGYNHFSMVLSDFTGTKDYGVNGSCLGLLASGINASKRRRRQQNP